MAHFVFTEKHEKSVNLDNVDFITKSGSRGREFAINFYKKVGTAKDASTTTIGNWFFDSEADRDSTFRQIMSGNGSDVGPHDSGSVVIA